jgi:hypothetical protein
VLSLLGYDTLLLAQVADADQHGGLTTFHDDKSDKQSAASMLVKVLPHCVTACGVCISAPFACVCTLFLRARNRMLHAAIWYVVTQARCAHTFVHTLYIYLCQLGAVNHYRSTQQSSCIHCTGELQVVTLQLTHVLLRNH